MRSSSVKQGFGLGTGRRIKTLRFRAGQTEFPQGIYLKDMKRDCPIQRCAQDTEPTIGCDSGHSSRLLRGDERKRIIWRKPSRLPLAKGSDDMRRMISILLLGDGIPLGCKILLNKLFHRNFLAIDLFPFTLLQNRPFLLRDQL